jgi:hypothetical protein
VAKRILFLALALVAIIGIPAVALTTWESFDQVITRSTPITENDDEFGNVQVYTVLDDGTLDPNADGLTQHVWEVFERVVTPEFAANVMSQYRVSDAPKSDTLAYVYQDDDPAHWVLATNLATSKVDSDLIATLIHEYAHIRTLDGTQMNQNATDCSTLDLIEGCANTDSYLWGFDQRFWAGYTDAPSVDNTDSDVAYDFYLDHEDDFVSDYAATNVLEDVAETFMTFVLEDEPEGDTVTAQKLGYFWQFPELVAERERIRAEFATELGLQLAG